ncbi:hypothetical protein [Ktedonospora formicarum]|uniref:Type II secretion system protein GspE N-terminal domain-containing protein n=1 Tax=Ktedonospora formicarum TaxID=2778364 RepID=A0A8J3MSX3_9CHLR|nr:hypothetical protein [Ktedonospora formicarum]GHO43775.1 hypothetical protein KSX_19380 [Ktedonospora formicarum]
MREQIGLVECIASVGIGEPSAIMLYMQGRELPYLARVNSYPSRRLLGLFPYELSRRYGCVPVGIERDAVTLATCQRLASEVIAQLQEYTRKAIFQVRCEEILIEELLNYWRDLLLV